MTPEAQIKPKNERDVWDSFDQVLGRHVERLIGSRYGIGGLPMDSKTLSCLILAMERENEIQTASTPATERYTPETLQLELNTLGFTLKQDIGTLTRDMIEKGYLNVDDNGRLVPEKPATSMTQLFERILPGMPGMNFVAYFIQTVEEVKTERKTLQDAISQFDQALQMQGVSIKAEQSRTKPQKASSPSAEQKKQLPKKVSSLQSKPRPSQLGTLKPSKTLDLLKSTSRSENSASFPGRPKIISQNAYSGQAKIQEVHFGKPTSDKKVSEEFNAKAEKEVESEKVQPQSETPPEEIDEAAPAVPTQQSNDASATDTPVSGLNLSIEKTDSEIDTRAAEAALNASSIKAVGITPETEDETDIASQPEDVDHSDEVIANRIASFEEDLAMECPLCRLSRVSAHETASGKKYYKCTNQTCGFVTWGKPHHLQCPRCSNPFLVEASGKDGSTVLKCPRATCRHWQNQEGERVGKSPALMTSETVENKNGTVSSRKPGKKRVRRKRVRRKK